MHGRRAFRGHRNLLGCYLPADDRQARSASPAASGARGALTRCRYM